MRQMALAIRRWWVFMGLSAALNLAVFALVGRSWGPLPRAAPPQRGPMLLTLLPPRARPHPPRPRPKRVPPRPVPPPKIARRATPLPPAPLRPPKVAPVAAPIGGARPLPMPRPQVPLVAVATPQADVPQTTKTVTTSTGAADTAEPGRAATPGPPPGAGTSGDGAGPGSGTGTAAGPFGITGGGGGGTGPRHVVYLLDTSGSMAMPVDKWRGQTRIQRAQAELDAQLRSLGPGETFSLIAFSDTIHPFQPHLVPADSQYVRSAENFLQALRPYGDTDLEGALDAAFAMPGVNVIYVITDGVPRTPDQDYSTATDFSALADRVDDANRQGARIYTIGLLGPNPDGTDESAQASALLAQIASDSGGTFKPVSLDDAPQDSGGP